MPSQHHDTCVTHRLGRFSRDVVWTEKSTERSTPPRHTALFKNDFSPFIPLSARPYSLPPLLLFCCPSCPLFPGHIHPPCHLSLCPFYAIQLTFIHYVFLCPFCHFPLIFLSPSFFSSSFVLFHTHSLFAYSCFFPHTVYHCSLSFPPFTSSVFSFFVFLGSTHLHSLHSPPSSLYLSIHSLHQFHPKTCPLPRLLLSIYLSFHFLLSVFTLTTLT